MLAHMASWAGVPTWDNTASCDVPTPIEPYGALTKEVLATGKDFITDQKVYPVL